MSVVLVVTCHFSFLSLLPFLLYDLLFLTALLLIVICPRYSTFKSCVESLNYDKGVSKCIGPMARTIHHIFFSAYYYRADVLANGKIRKYNISFIIVLTVFSDVEDGDIFMMSSLRYNVILKRLIPYDTYDAFETLVHGFHYCINSH